LRWEADSLLWTSAAEPLSFRKPRLDFSALVGEGRYRGGIKVFFFLIKGGVSPESKRPDFQKVKGETGP